MKQISYKSLCDIVIFLIGIVLGLCLFILSKVP